METKVSVKEKKQFIEWFIGKFRYEKDCSQAQLFLYYALRNETNLERITFVNKYDSYEKQNDSYENYLEIKISDQNENQMLLINKKEFFTTTNPALMFKKTLENNEEKLFIKLIFESESVNREYKKVVGFDSSTPEEKKETMKTAEYLVKEHFLLTKIDEALDTNNKELFIKMSEELKSIEESKVYN